MPGKSIEDIYQQWTDLKHVRHKDMWAGAKGIVELSKYIYKGDPTTLTGKLVKSQVRFSPIWNKCFDEPIVNCIDQYTRTKDQYHSMSVIQVTFDKTTGEISIFNDGPGIPVKMHKIEKKYIPEMVASSFKSGSNLQKDSGAITGGENGIGLKLTNGWSSEFQIETNDGVKYYKQKWINNFNDDTFNTQTPTIINASSAPKPKSKQFTKITYKPFFNKLGYTYDGCLCKEDADLMENLIISRLFHASAFMGIPSNSRKNVKNKVNVYYNKKLVPIRDLKSLADSIIDSDKATIVLESTHNWELVCGISNDGFESISLINGVVCKNGTHMTYLTDQMSEILKTRIEKITKGKRYRKMFMENHLFLFFKGYIPDTQWGGQRKDELTVDRKKFTHKLQVNNLLPFWKILSPYISAIFDEKSSDVDTTAKKRLGYIKKYTPADIAGKSRSLTEPGLIVPEGDSAEATVVVALTNKKTPISYKNLGVFNIQGVPMNARKEITIKKIKNVNVPTRSQKLKNNERLTSLVDVIGLDYNHSYDTNPLGDSQFALLRYKYVLITTDQDIDGMGNIRGMLVNFIHVFWPNLIKRGFVKFLSTVLMWAYPKSKGKVLSFYNDNEYRKWISDNFLDDIDMGRKYDIKYCKGLAGHEDAEIIHMFENFNKMKRTFTSSATDNDLFETYYGKKTDGRKKELITPVDFTLPGVTDLDMTCSHQLQVPTKEYMLDNIERKLFHCIDGLLPTRRKVLAAARQKFSTNGKPIKVFQLGGYAAEHFNYHHGSDSINGTIITMAADFTGARNLPFLRAKGQFGTRKKNGNDAGSARYISTTLNKALSDAVFPPIDDSLLEWSFDDGTRGEPKYYVPVIPMVVLETMSIPATGWKVGVYARDFTEVIASIKKMINSTNKSVDKSVDKLRLGEFSEWVYNFKGEIRTHGASKWAYGDYVLNEITETVHITELPLGMASATFCENLIDKKEYIKSVKDKTGKNDIDILVEFKKNTLSKIQDEYGDADQDCIEHYLGIRKKLDQFLNFVDKDNNVKEFPSYQSVIKYWFPIRREYYELRIDRRILILQLQIMEITNIIRFTELKKSLGLEKKTKTVAFSILDTNKFLKINHVALHNCKYIPTKSLEYEVLKNTDIHSYSYLMNLNSFQLLDEALLGYKDTLVKLQEQLRIIQNRKEPFKGATEWKNDLADVERVVKLGLSKGWSYGKDNTNFA